VDGWLSGGAYDGIGVVTGGVSGNLELIELEGHAIRAGALETLMEAATRYECDELLRRVLAGCSSKSAGGGLHTLIRVTDGPARKNTQLAFGADGRILAETRGEGGFVIVAPTPARTGHEPGSKYEFLTRGPEAIAEVTSEERDVLHMLFTLALNQAPQPVAAAEQRPPAPRGEAPGDRYAADHTWQQILEPAGWVVTGHGQRGSHPVIYWRRPGKTEGTSGNTGGPGDHLYVFSSSTCFPPGQALTKFAAYAWLHHGGDFQVAARALAAEGYGTRSQENGFGEFETGPAASDTQEDSERPEDTFSDLSWVFSGERRPPAQPEFLQTDAGHCLLYRGRINGIFGDPETAKSWLAQYATTQALLVSQRVAYLDIDHNGAAEIAERLLLLGANPSKIADPGHFRVYEPQDRQGLARFVQDMLDWKPDFVTIDSLGELMPMLGAKSVDNDELTAAIRATLKPLAHTAGACVFTIDHLPKGQDARASGYAIGGIAKKRIIDGAYLSAEALEPPAPGKTGKIRLTIEKDRHGQVRAHAIGKVAGDYIIDSTDPTYTNCRIEQPPTGTDGKIKPTSAMTVISQYLASQPDWTAPSRNSIHTALAQTHPFKRHTIERAIDELAQDQHLLIEPSAPGKPSPVKLVKPYGDQLTDISRLLS
jgi:hypothetical protein